MLEHRNSGNGRVGLCGMRVCPGATEGLYSPSITKPPSRYHSTERAGVPHSGRSHCGYVSTLRLSVQTLSRKPYSEPFRTLEGGPTFAVKRCPCHCLKPCPEVALVTLGRSVLACAARASAAPLRLRTSGQAIPGNPVCNGVDADFVIVPRTAKPPRCEGARVLHVGYRNCQHHSKNPRAADLFQGNHSPGGTPAYPVWCSCRYAAASNR